MVTSFLTSDYQRPSVAPVVNRMKATDQAKALTEDVKLSKDVESALNTIANHCYYSDNCDCDWDDEDCECEETKESFASESRLLRRAYMQYQRLVNMQAERIEALEAKVSSMSPIGSIGPIGGLQA